MVGSGEGNQDDQGLLHMMCRERLSSWAEEKATRGSSCSPNPHHGSRARSFSVVYRDRKSGNRHKSDNEKYWLGKSFSPQEWSSFGMGAQRDWTISILLREPEFRWTKLQETCSWLGTGLSRDPFWSKLLCDFVVLMMHNTLIYAYSKP